MCAAVLALPGRRASGAASRLPEAPCPCGVSTATWLCVPRPLRVARGCERLVGRRGALNVDGRFGCVGPQVSRALGDYLYKQVAHFPQEKQQVSCEPETTVFKRDEKDDYLILACDGIWDVMTNEDVVEFVRSRVRAGETDLGVVRCVRVLRAPGPHAPRPRRDSLGQRAMLLSRCAK